MLPVVEQFAGNLPVEAFNHPRADILAAFAKNEPPVERSTTPYLVLTPLDLNFKPSNGSDQK